jgi:hypothetical protein
LGEVIGILPRAFKSISGPARIRSELAVGGLDHVIAQFAAQNLQLPGVLLVDIEFFLTLPNHELPLLQPKIPLMQPLVT